MSIEQTRKRAFYTEDRVYAAVSFADFKEELFPKVRNLIYSYKSSHPWLSLSNEQLLRTAGLWRRDLQTGLQGYTLAAILLFGTDELIREALPAYKIDAMVRRQEVDRYDDREYITCNLIEAYDKLMQFIEKHLPDKFYLEGEQRVSLRSKIFREVVANMLVHREYTNAHPCTLVIYADRVETRNANNPHGEGPIDPDHFAPFPKNPTIAKFFIELGRVEEIGSGVLNVNRLAKLYGGGRAIFSEGPVFSMQLSLPSTWLQSGGDSTTSGGVVAESGGVLEKSGGASLGSGGVSDAENHEQLIETHFGHHRQDLKKKLAILLAAIERKPDGLLPTYVQETGFPLRSLERYTAMLKEAGLLTFQDGYRLTDQVFIRL